MTPMQQFYLDRAAEAGRTAAAAPLANIRERHLLAELTWNGLADRAGRVASLHAGRVAATVAAAAANAEAAAAAPTPLQEPR